MAIKLGSTDISDIRLGDNQVSAVYVGDKLVWEKVQSLYTTLNFLESTGTQYIKSGYVWSANDVVEIDMTVTNPPNDTVLFGCYDGNLFEVGFLNGCFRFNIDGQPNYAYSLNQRYSLKNNAGQWSVNGVNVGPFSNSSQANESFIFARNYAGGDKFTRSRVHSITVKRGGVVIKNFIPAKRNSDNAIGILETISNVFLTNSGSGNFLYG